MRAAGPEYGVGASNSSAAGSALLLAVGLQERQFDEECRSAFLGGLVGDSAVVLGQNAMRNGQAQPSAATDRLGREERLENMRQNVGWNARAAICDPDQEHAVALVGGDFQASWAIHSDSAWIALVTRFTTTCSI